jgi:hypothetical protein
MGFTSAAIIRPLVGSILRNGTWAHAFLCHRCLVTLEQLGRGYNDYEARRGMGKNLREPVGPCVYARVSLREVSGHSRVPERHVTRQSTENATSTANGERHLPLRYNDA